ncbi:14281_t:CDS:1, partial [Racocetra persica]
KNYGLPKFHQNSDLEIDLTVANIKKNCKNLTIIGKGCTRFIIVSTSPPEIFSKSVSIKNDAVAVKANVKKVL